MGSRKSGAHAVICSNAGSKKPFAAMLIVFILPDEIPDPDHCDDPERTGTCLCLSL